MTNRIFVARQKNKRSFLIISVPFSLNKFLCYCSFRNKNNIVFMVQGYYVCKTAWMTAYGIGRTICLNTYQSFIEGVVRFDQNPCNTGLSHKSNIAAAWMQMTFNRIGDMMPDSLTIHLPSYLDFKILYQYMKTDLEEQGENCISYSQFCKLMKTHFHDVRIPKVCK